MEKWYRIDNAGHMYSSITSTRVTTLFRFSIELKETIDVKNGNYALRKTLERFPFLNANLRSGFFWFYLRSSRSFPELEEETYYPCMNLYLKKSRIFPFRVLYFKKKLSFEFSHIIFDGESALKFISVFISYYLKECGKITELLPVCKEDFSDEERENGFRKHYDNKVPSIKNTDKAYKLKYKLSPKGSFFVCSGLMDIKDIKEVSKKYNASIFIFLMAVYIKTIIEINENIKRPIVINVPVSLRNFFPSKTMSNYFITITPSIDPRVGEYSLEEIIDYLKNYFAITLNEKTIRRYISTAVKYEDWAVFKMMPLFLKNIILPNIYKTYGENTFTSGISNLGRVSFSKEIDENIERIDVFAAPSTGNIIKAILVSFDDKLSFTFSKLTLDKSFEREFFRNLREYGIVATVENNYNL